MAEESAMSITLATDGYGGKASEESVTDIGDVAVCSERGKDQSSPTHGIDFERQRRFEDQNGLFFLFISVINKRI